MWMRSRIKSLSAWENRTTPRFRETVAIVPHFVNLRKRVQF